MAEFRISTNINRDADAKIDYIVTRNTNDVYDSILHHYKVGQHAFTIIGSYGTGKSSFLWAFEQHVKGETIFASPVNGAFSGTDKVDFVRIVGEAISFKAMFCDTFGLGELKNATNKMILAEFEQLCSDIMRKNRSLVFFVDEFGKHLEYIAKNDPQEMYFIQELAEFCNDPNKSVLFISTLHQNFSVYAKGLSKAQKSEWDKVKGRLLDIAFDEPVEQLLFFASKRLEGIPLLSQNASGFKVLVKRVVDSNLLGKSLSDMKLMERLYPLDPLAADILTKSLQRYGQNERSLFTFLESEEIRKKELNQNYFSVADCFDYLVDQLGSEIEDGEKNPFKPQWRAAIIALEKAEVFFEGNYNDAAKLIKLICLVNIFSSASGRLDDDILETYGAIVLGIDGTKDIVDRLIEKRVIKYSNHRSKYNFIDGTDLDIDQELINASKYIDQDFDLVSRLKAYFNFGVVPAKRAQFEFGTPRLFYYNFCASVVPEEPKNEYDGSINLIFSERKTAEEIQLASMGASTQVFVLFRDIKSIRDAMFEIDKINYVIEKHADDKVALQILQEEMQFQLTRLSEHVSGKMYRGDESAVWIWNGEINTNVHSKRHLNAFLSKICIEAYPDTPVYKNEMVNKEYLSTPILTARKALIRQLINKGDEEDIGFEGSRFPPERTIYLSLLKMTGIHRKNESKGYGFGCPENLTFLKLWERSESILVSSRKTRMVIAAFYEELKVSPFKLKQGFLNFWVPIFLVIKKEDYALYTKDGEYIPHLTTDVMDLIHKSPSKYMIKALDSDGVQTDYLGFYKELVGFNESNIKGLSSSYITIFSNFLRFYRGLEAYAVKTKQLPQTAIGLRQAIASAKDPESALFKDIPIALGYYNVQVKENADTLQNFLEDLKLNIKHLRGAYDNLVDTIQLALANHLGLDDSDFAVFKAEVMRRFVGVKSKLIVNEQMKVFAVRIVSPLDVKKAYWESLCDAALGKKLERISDDEVPMLIERMKHYFDTLLNLVDIHQLSVGQGEEGMRISVLHQDGKETVKHNVVVNEITAKAATDLSEEISKVLGNDTDLNKLALIKLLEKEFLKNGRD